MSGVSAAQTPCEVFYHVFSYKGLYGQMIRALNRARNHVAEGKLFCINFRNPLSGVNTLLTGARIIEICDHPSTIVWCSPDERIAGLVLLYASFFSCVLGSYYKAERHRNQLTLYCKSVKVPKQLFPALPQEFCQFTIRGNQIIALMCAALGQSGVPRLVSQGGPPVQASLQSANGGSGFGSDGPVPSM
jgi:hypothetical protein